MAQPRVLIVGGAGVFGRLLARELSPSFDVEIAGRSIERTERVARTLGVAWRALDLTRAGGLTGAAREFDAVVCAAGPFRSLPPTLPRDTMRAGAHWLDIADDPEWVLRVLRDRTLDADARASGVAVMTGLSSTPALSGALVRWAASRLDEPARARVTLAIGNRNAKGPAAIESALAGRFRDPSTARLPNGARRAYAFDSADLELLRDALGIETEFRVALEWGVAGRLVAAAGRVRSAPAARVLARAAVPFGLVGSRGGGVLAEVWDPRGRGSALAAWSALQGFAIAPCAIAVRELLDGGGALRGVVDPGAWCATRAGAVRARGIRLLRPAALSSGW